MTRESKRLSGPTRISEKSKKEIRGPWMNNQGSSAFLKSYQSPHRIVRVSEKRALKGHGKFLPEKDERLLSPSILAGGRDALLKRAHHRKVRFRLKPTGAHKDTNL